jgi:putative ABC transport system permease protein
MYIIHNALANVRRNIGRNLMIGAIVFAIIVTAAVSLIINNTAAAVIEDYRGRFASEVFIRLDFQRMQQQFSSGGLGLAGGQARSLRMATMETELQLALADSPYLKESVATGSVMGGSGGIRAIDQRDPGDTAAADGGRGAVFSGGAAFNITTVGMGSALNYQLMGGQWEDFTQGTRSLASGRFPENDFEAVLSLDLAEENGLSLGDTVTFTATLRADTPEGFDMDAFEGDAGVYELNGVLYDVSVNRDWGLATMSREVEYALTIVGFYYDLNDEYAHEMMAGNALMNRRNEVLTTLGTLLAPRAPGET